MSETTETKTFWITKYAMTKGVFRADNCDVSIHGNATYACRKFGFCMDSDYLFVRIGTDAFETEEEAKANAAKKARAKLKSMDKQRAKVQALLDGWTK